MWGKLCFGFEENCQFVQAEAAGDKALEYTPRDIWAIHSMSHVHEETGMLVVYNSTRFGHRMTTGNELIG